MITAQEPWSLGFPLEPIAPSAGRPYTAGNCPNLVRYREVHYHKNGTQQEVDCPGESVVCGGKQESLKPREKW